MAIALTSPRQDCGGVRTAADIERKYDLAAIVGMKKAIIQAENQLTKTNKMLEEFVASTLGTLENMQSQIDGNITTWFDYGKPTLNTYPTDEWITDEMKINHIGDLYYDRNTGYAYRYETTEDGSYCWEKIKDNDVVEALAIANAAKDTADNKRRVFVNRPAPPYDNGDLWFNEEGEIYICQITKDEEQQYEDKDFIIATKYTDDTYAKKVGQELTVIRGTVTTIKESVDEFKVDIELLQDEVREAQTTIRANTDGIELSVKKGEIIGAINVSSEKVLIDAKKINLVGAVTADCINVKDLAALNATIGGWTIGKSLSATASTYVAPSSIERDKVRNYILGGSLTSTEQSASDLNKDGSVSQKDLLIMNKILFGEMSYAEQAGAKRTNVTMEINPTNAEKLIRLSGTNAWGRSIEQYFGINGLNTDNVVAKSVVSNNIETTSGANLDTINSNLTALKSESNDLQHLGTFIATTTAQTFTINNFAGYKTLVFIPYDGSLNLDSVFIPVSAFRSGLQVSFNAYALANYRGVVSVSRVSDTSISCQVREIIGWSQIGFRVYGMV